MIRKHATTTHYWLDLSLADSNFLRDYVRKHGIRNNVGGYLTINQCVGSIVRSWIDEEKLRVKGYERINNDKEDTDDCLRTDVGG